MMNKSYNLHTALREQYGPGMTHIAGRSGSGKTTVAESFVDNAVEQGRPAAYHRMRPRQPWTETLTEMSVKLGNGDQPVYSIPELLNSVGKSAAPLLVFDDYRHRPPAAAPGLLAEQIEAHESASIVTFSLPDWRLDYAGVLEPLPPEEWSDLGEAGQDTGGWPRAVETMREVLTDDDIPENGKNKMFYRRMKEHRLSRFFGKQRVGKTGRQYLLAIAEITGGEDLLASVSEIALRLNRPLSAFGPCRQTLLQSGIIYAPEKGKVGFSDPTHSKGMFMETRSAG